MPAPATKPPSIKDFPKAIRSSIKPVLDYIEKTHIEDVKIEQVVGLDNHKVEFTRGETGVIMHIKLATNTC